jgi:hypothetical protein
MISHSLGAMPQATTGGADAEFASLWVEKIDRRVGRLAA